MDVYERREYERQIAELKHRLDGLERREGMLLDLIKGEHLRIWEHFSFIRKCIENMVDVDSMIITRLNEDDINPQPAPDPKHSIN